MSNRELKSIGTDVRDLVKPAQPEQIDVSNLKKAENVDTRPAGETMNASTTIMEDLALYFRVRLKRLIGDEEAGKATQLLPLNPFKLAGLVTGSWTTVLVVLLGVGLVLVQLFKPKNRAG